MREVVAQVVAALQHRRLVSPDAEVGIAIDAVGERTDVEPIADDVGDPPPGVLLVEVNGGRVSMTPGSPAGLSRLAG